MVSHYPVTPLDALHSDLLGESDRRTHPGEGRHIRASDPLKPLGADLRVVPAFRGEHAPQAIDNFIAHVEEPATLGRLQPLVRTRGVQITAELMQVHLHHADYVSAVHRAQDSLRARKCTQL